MPISSSEIGVPRREWFLRRRCSQKRMNTMRAAPMTPNTTPSAIPNVRSLVCFGVEGASVDSGLGAPVDAGLSSVSDDDSGGELDGDAVNDGVDSAWTLYVEVPITTFVGQLRDATWVMVLEGKFDESREFASDQSSNGTSVSVDGASVDPADATALVTEPTPAADVCP